MRRELRRPDQRFKNFREKAASSQSLSCGTVVVAIRVKSLVLGVIVVERFAPELAQELAKSIALRKARIYIQGARVCWATLLREL